MKVWNSNYNNKLIIISIIIMLITIGLIFYLLNLKIQNSFNAILEVDINKQFMIRLPTANLNLISSTKNILITLEGKDYLIYNPELVYKGNNSYIVVFNNIDLYHLVKSNSLYNIKIFSGSKKIIDFLF